MAADATGAKKVAELRATRGALTESGLQHLGNYRYKGGTYTPLDNFLNANFWTPAAKFLPEWIAPNAVTLLGLLWMVGSWFVLTWHAPNLKAEAPRWVYAFSAFSLFMYQTLDVFDGKQARRTNSSSPLGQLFDHGCDSVSTTFIALSVATTCGLGFSVRTVLLLFSAQVPFWFAQWSEYHTHELTHSLGFIGVTEAQLVSVSVFLLSAIFGNTFWSYELGTGITLPEWYCAPGPARLLQFADVGLAGQLAAALMMTLQSVTSVFTKATRKMTALLQTLPIILHAALGYCWCMNPQPHPRLVLFSLGMSFTFLTNQMIVAAMAHQEYPIFHTILLPLPILFATEKYNLTPRHNDVLLGAYTSYCLYKLYRYTRQVIEEITRYLGIHAFKLGKRKD